MAAEVKSLPPVRLPAAASTLTADQRYWSGFSSQQLLPTLNSAPVTYISTNSPTHLSSQSSNSSKLIQSSATPSTYYIVVTTASRIQLFSPQTLRLIRTISRTSSPFHGASIRIDSRVVVAGSDNGVIQAFDTTSRSILKTWNHHKQPVWVTQWNPKDVTSLMSCSDDTTVRIWDLPSENPVWTGWGHTDYVRSGGFIGESPHLLVTGGYDSSIRIWDTRISSAGSKACVMNFKLSSPIETVLPLSNGTTLAGASGEKISILDLVAARPIQQLYNHQKTVTSLSLATHGTRMLSASLDGHLKVFDTSSWTVVAGFKYPSPILSLSNISTQNSDRHICVGMQSGLLSIRTKLTASARAAKHEREKELDALASGTIEKFDKKRKAKRKQTQGWSARLRGKDYTGEGADIIIDPRATNTGALRSKEKQSQWEYLLRRGQYSAALDNCLKTHDTGAILTLLTALHHRDALNVAIAGRSASGILPILKWITKRVGDPRFTKLSSLVATVLVEEYSLYAGQNEEVDVAFEKLHEVVRGATELSQMAVSTIGMMELLGASTA